MTDAGLQDVPRTEPSQDNPEPATPPKPFRFTRENAKKYSEVGRAAWKAQREAQRLQEIKDSEPKQTDPPELKLALADCTRLSSILAGKLAPLERAELSKALDRMLDRVRIIRGFPLPGTATSRAPAAAQSPASSMLTSGSVAPVAQDARPPREDQE